MNLSLRAYGLLTAASASLYTLFPVGVHAQIDTGIERAGVAAGYGSASADIPTLVANAINVILGLVGIVFVILLVYSGILYLTSQGDADRVKTAKQNITNAVIGIVIIVGAYTVTQFVVGTLTTVVGNSTVGDGGCPPGQIPRIGGGCE